MTNTTCRLAGRRTLGLLALLAAGGCAPAHVEAPANLVMRNDFEAVAGWGEVPGSLTDEQAHSGHYATKTDGNNEFSMGYAMLLGKVKLPPSRRLKVRAWARRSGEGARSALVVQVFDPAHNNQQVYRDALVLEKQVLTYNRWMMVEQTFVLPSNCTDEQQLRVYMWRDASNQPTYLDDIEVTRD